MSHLASELRYLRRELVRVNRRLALAHVEGPVVERDEKKWLVRLELGTDDDGKKILSPWVKPYAHSAGALKDSPALPAVGDRMRLHSPSGIVGAASYAIPSAFDDELTRPSGQDKDEAAREFGKTRVSQTAEKITLATEHTSLVSSKDGVAVDGHKNFSAKADEVRLEGKTTRIHGESLDKIKFIVGGQAYQIKPDALLPTSA